MSAANPLPSQRRPVIDAQLFELSMEDILASIRRIITDDQAAEGGEGRGAGTDPVRLAGDDADPARLGATPPEAADAGPLRPVWTGASAASGRAPSPRAPAPALVSPAADASVAAAFNALVASRFAQNSDAVAALTAEALRPMLRAWLDEHLPPLVERLVKAEIERIVRGD